MRASSASFASACCSAVLLLAACGRTPAGETGADASASASAGTGASAGARASAGAGAAEPVAATSIGHTSYVLKLRLSDGTKAAFKPRSNLPLGDHRYRGEIAAHRLARALGLDNVPPALPRAFDAATLRSLEPSVAERALVDDDGRVRGAFIPWIERYEVLPLEESRWRDRWEPWLFDARSAIPEAQRALASSISTMIVFDYVTANWDRWSGGNVARDGGTGKVLFVDNDGAFYEWPAPATLAKQLAVVARITRLSRRFVDALRSLDESAIRGAIGDESPGMPLLPTRAIAGVDARRRTALQTIDARLGDAGAGYAFE